VIRNVDLDTTNQLVWNDFIKSYILIGPAGFGVRLYGESLTASANYVNNTAVPPSLAPVYKYRIATNAGYVYAQANLGSITNNCITADGSCTIANYATGFEFITPSSTASTEPLGNYYSTPGINCYANVNGTC
jgi:hypothetical protein